MYLAGDVDNDQKLSIIDATEIQKAIANITEIVKFDHSDETVYDFNGDGQVNIIDSTEIQKSLIS